jgi:hypothetical protein
MTFSRPTEQLQSVGAERFHGRGVEDGAIRAGAEGKLVMILPSSELSITNAAGFAQAAKST